MYQIYYILNNRMDIMNCRDKLDALISYNQLVERGASIVCIKDRKGDSINTNLT